MVVNWRSKAGAALALLAPLLLLASCRELEPDDPLPDWGNPNWDAGPRDGPAPPPGDGHPPPPKQDARPADLGDAPPPPPPPPPGSIKVASVQYGPTSYEYVPGCTDINCGLIHFIKEAAQNGAQYVNIPEYALDYEYVEWHPQNGIKPATHPDFGPQTSIGQMAQLADDEDITLIFNAVTQVGSGDDAELFNTHIAINGEGVVVQTHKKYYLYANEKDYLTAGTNCCDMFDTPAGKAAMLICADINCIVYLDASKSSCTAYGLQKLQEFAASPARIVFFSSAWLAWKNPIWKATAVMAKLATYAGVYVVGSNWIDGNYHGGGVFAPDGTALDVVDSTVPSVTYGVIPPPGGTPPPPGEADVVITEFIPNPSAVSDGKGEWFELYNAADNPVDLGGWTIKDNSGKSHTISALVIPAKEYAVLAINDNTTTNGGVTVDYKYPTSWTITNTQDEILLYDAASQLVDKVEYSASSWTIPNGASLSLKALDADNNDPGNWCAETAAWPGSAGDKGTPGAAAGCQ